MGSRGEGAQGSNRPGHVSMRCKRRLSASRRDNFAQMLPQGIHRDKVQFLSEDGVRLYAELSLMVVSKKLPTEKDFAHIVGI